MSGDWQWLALGLMGAYHGANPAMGWLFAVALGLQEKRRSAVLQALGPIALGHAASVALVVALVVATGLVVAPDALRLAGALALILFGLYKLRRPRSHPRWVGMRVRWAELGAWSFLMSTAHGAGLMLLPILLSPSSGASAGGHHVGSAAPPALAAVLVHTGSLLAVMALVALVVYEWLGVAFLRRAWVNLDLLWAPALIVAGVLTVLI